MIDYLRINNILSKHTQLIHQDILKRDEEVEESLGQKKIEKSKTLVTGNLPYYITSPILRKFFEGEKTTRVGGVFLIQQEVADKIVHDAPKKSFLRWLINFSYRVEYVFSVPPQAFTPPPKVTSAVIRILPKQESDIPLLDFMKLKTFLDLYSPYKRKTL